MAEYLFLHGLGVEMAEALAEYWHRRIREEWGFADEDGPSLGGLFRQKYRGGRYSWGYPACPDLEDNARVAELVDVERIGVSLSDGFQLDPEQTTSVIICLVGARPTGRYAIHGSGVSRRRRRLPSPERPFTTACRSTGHAGGGEPVA